MSVARALLRQARHAGFSYRCFHVMRLPLTSQTAPDVTPPPGLAFLSVDPQIIERSADEVIRDTAWYGGPGGEGFALARDGRILSLQWIWHGERLQRADFWSFKQEDAVSMHLVTVPDARGHGLATDLKRLTAARMRERGFTCIYSRIWWTNEPSLRVSKKVGWARVGTTLSVMLPWRQMPLEWRWQRCSHAGR